MATKNMSRSVIEGGRNNSNKWRRHESNRSHRSRNREFSRRLRALVDPDDIGPAPKRYPIRKEFADKLGCMYRWLQSQVGSKWDAVFSELSCKFDTRTVAGRHIVYAHLLNAVILNVTDVEHEHNIFFRGNRYYVDELGLLSAQERTPKSAWDVIRGRRKRLDIQKWANNRMVMDYGVSIFWMNPTEIEWYNCATSVGKLRDGTNLWSSTSPPCYRHHRVTTQLKKANLVPMSEDSPLKRKLVKKIEIEYGVTREVYYLPVEVRQCQRGSGMFLQGDRFSEEDMAIWNQLTEHERYELLWVKPKTL